MSADYLTERAESAAKRDERHMLTSDARRGLCAAVERLAILTRGWTSHEPDFCAVIKAREHAEELLRELNALDKAQTECRYRGLA